MVRWHPLPVYVQVVQEVLLWSRAPMEVRRLCARKEELFRELRGDAAPAMPPGTDPLLRLLEKHNVRACSACTLLRRCVGTSWLGLLLPSVEPRRCCKLGWRFCTQLAAVFFYLLQPAVASSCAPPCQAAVHRHQTSS